MLEEISRTLVIIKPDAVQRRLLGAIISRLENKGLKIVGMKMVHMPREQAERNYAVHKDKDFFGRLIDFMTSGPVVLVVVEGKDGVNVVRRLMGTTNSVQADAGTIRGDFGIRARFNLIHGSDSPENAKMEIGLFFEDSELLVYEMPEDVWLEI